MEESASDGGRDPRATTQVAHAAQAAEQTIRDQLTPWYEAVEHPAQAQESVLRRLLHDYAQTGYGADHDAAKVAESGTVEDAIVAEYRRAFPIMTYNDCKPLIDAVMAGDTGLLLCEEPVGWAITRGTVEGESKFIPMTPTDLRMRVSAGRAMLGYVAATKRLDLFAGVNLNLNFPSTVLDSFTGERLPVRGGPPGGSGYVMVNR